MGAAREILSAMAFALVLVTAPAAARAEAAVHSTAVVSIAGSQAPRDIADLRAASLVEALGEPRPTTAEESREALLRQVGRNEVARVGNMARRAEAALAAFDDLEVASRLLRRAADAHLDILPLLDTLEAPVRLLVGLATVELALGRENEVNRALVTALRLDPALDLDPEEVSPRLVRALRRARADAEDLPLLSSEQATTLARRLGVERLLVVQPRPGAERTLVEHYLGSSGARLRPWLIRGAAVASIAGQIRPTSGADSPDSSPSTDLGAQPGAREPASHGGRADSGEPAAFGSSVGAADDEGAGARERRPVYRRWWFWTLIGVVVVGGAAAGVVLGTGIGQPQQHLPLEVRGHF